MKPVILITRPAENAEIDPAIRSTGFRPLLAPALRIIDLPVTLPDSSTIQGLIFSSANGVRAFGKLNPDPAFLRKPVFTVGDHTAEIAAQAGFTDVRSASGTMKNLAGLVRRQMVPPSKLLHLRGRDVRENPAILLPQSEGWSVDGITLYEAERVNAPAPEAVEALDAGQVEAVLFYSARSAAAFMNLYKRFNFRGIQALCLAESVVESLDRSQWAEIIVSARPDQSGMMALLKRLKPEKTMPIFPRIQTANDDVNALTNAEAVIERFGGIRPMATKMNVPVTTVQGWKKRNVIPGNRRDDVLDAAQLYNVDLSDIIASQNDNEPAGNDFRASLNTARREEVRHPEIDLIHRQAISGAVTHEDMMKALKKSQVSTIRKSVTASAGLVMVLAMFGGLFIAIGNHRLKSDEARITALEEQAPVAQGGPTPFARMMDSMKARIDGVEASLKNIGTQAGMAMGPSAEGSITQRLSTLENLVKSIAGGDATLGAAGNQLQTLVQGLQGRMDKMDEALAEQQKSNTALGQALEGVSPKELKAAAMLIGLNQFRESLGRNEPFAEDLAMMQRLTGDQDPELNAAIAKLAPYAEKGVLSPNGLSSELKGLTGDILVASVNGEDASIQDRAMARFQKYVSIEKDGKPVLGNDAQARVAKAQALLDAGDINGAMAELQTLQGPARQKAQPVIDQGMVTLMAQNVQNMLSKNIVSQIKGAVNPVPLTANPGLGGLVAPLGINTQPVQQGP
ncbi:MAG: hypothetical protein JWO78_1745 [Micavibrio sp.]|nr:hypothetical protein [Micavibrio sp.]